MSTTLTIRIDEETKERLDRLAESVARSKSYLVTRALQDYLDLNELRTKKSVEINPGFHISLS